MATIHPFRAVRPRPELAARVACVPYDVVDRDEARRLAADDPLSFLHVTRPDVDLPDDIDPHDDAVYAQAASAYRWLRQEGVLVQDEEPSLYLYRQVMGEHSQTGLVACCSVGEYDRDLIKKHEKTRPDKEDDRTRHMLTLSAHPGPVFLTYRGRQQIDALVARWTAGEPIVDVAAEDGVRHQVWAVPDPAALVAEMREVPALYVADGHHRSAAASRAAAERRRSNSQPTGDEEYERFLAVLFPADQLRILPYNRVVHDLGGRSPEAFLESLREVLDVSPEGTPEPGERGRFGMYLGGRWHTLTASEELRGDDPVESLDAAVLQRAVLGPLLGIDDPRTSERIDFVGGIRGTAELARRVDRRGGGVAFSLHPVSVEQLMAVADAGRVLPPKSTWFEPKLRSGLFVHEL